jgi:hypothetical protein
MAAQALALGQESVRLVAAPGTDGPGSVTLGQPSTNSIQLPAPVPLEPGPAPPFCPVPLPPLPLIPPSAASADALRRARDELKATRERLELDRADARRFREVGPIDDVGRAQLRLRLSELIRRLSERPKKPPKLPEISIPPEQIPPGRVPVSVSEETVEPQDPLALPEAYYRAGKHDAALAALKALRRDEFSRRDQLWIAYLSAGCLRQQGKLKEAAVVYREVAAREDPFLAEMSVWHLSVLSWREEVEAGIDRIAAGKAKGDR